MALNAAGDRISEHEVRLLLVFLREIGRWLTNNEVAQAARVSPRTARLHTLRLAALGVLRAEKVFPASKFRLAEAPPEEGREYLERWEKAREVFGL